MTSLMLAAAVALLLVPSRVLACLLSRLVPLYDEDPAPETLQKKLLPRALVYGFSTAVVYLAVYPILNMLFSTSLLSLGIYLPLLTMDLPLWPCAGIHAQGCLQGPAHHGGLCFAAGAAGLRP